MKWFFALILILPCLASEPLRLVAYNIHHGEGMDRKVDLARIAKVIALEKPDLVALQEVDEKCRRSGSVDQAAELGKLLKMEHRFGKFMDFQGGRYGLAILSRLPIEETFVHQLPEGAEPRVALEVVVKSSDWPGKFSFVSIHNDWKSEAIRVTQVAALQKALKERTHPIILAGDFNAVPKSDSLQLLTKDSWKILRKKSKKTWPSEEPRQEIDFFIAKGLPAYSYKDKIVPEVMASDHRPIAVEISSTGKKAN